MMLIEKFYGIKFNGGFVSFISLHQFDVLTHTSDLKMMSKYLDIQAILK